MNSPAEISICTDHDYNQILDELHEFWGARDTRHLHHPFLIHEFGNSAFVIRNGGKVVAYLFGFLSQSEPVGYVHAVAVRMSARRRRLAQELFRHFVEFARRHGCKHVKAITRRQIWSPSHFTKASACSFSANPIAMEFRSSPTTPAAAHRASSFGRRSRRTSSPHGRRRADRPHGVCGAIAPDPGRPWACCRITSRGGSAAISRQLRCRRGPLGPRRADPR